MAVEGSATSSANGLRAQTVSHASTAFRRRKSLPILEQSAILQRVRHNLTPYAMPDKPGQSCYQENPPRHSDEAGFSTGHAARAETRSRRHVARCDISRIADISPNGGNTPRRAVAEGFEPPDGVSRLSLSRRVH